MDIWWFCIIFLLYYLLSFFVFCLGVLLLNECAYLFFLCNDFLLFCWSVCCWIYTIILKVLCNSFLLFVGLCFLFCLLNCKIGVKYILVYLLLEWLFCLMRYFGFVWLLCLFFCKQYMIVDVFFVFVVV